MTKYEYKVIRTLKSTHYDLLLEYLNKQGQEGWELCTTEYGAFIFKREIRPAHFKPGCV